MRWRAARTEARGLLALVRERPDGLTIGLEALKKLAGKLTLYKDLRVKLERFAAGQHDEHSEDAESLLEALDRVQASVRSRGVDLAGWEHDVKTERQAIAGSPTSCSTSREDGVGRWSTA